MDEQSPRGKTVLMVSALTQNIRSLSGHTVFFKKNTPTEVPLSAVDECLAKGCAPVDADEVDALNAARDAKLQAEHAKVQRIMDGITQLVLKNNPNSFTAGGKPSDKALEALLGEPITADQRDMAWRLWRDKNRQAELEEMVAEEGRQKLASRQSEDQSEAAPGPESDDTGTADEDGVVIPGG